MKPFRAAIAFTLVLWALGDSQHLQAEVRVAVASNFIHGFEALHLAFVKQAEGSPKESITPVYGSTGKLYAQIINGAPFDAFFAADSERPERLVAGGLATEGSRFTYALGRLVLWSPDSELVDPQGSILATGDFQRLAIANARLAPYGLAAESVLEKLGVHEQLRHRIVRGENINQAFQYVYSGNAELGLISAAQWQILTNDLKGSAWQVPPTLHKPIRQQAVTLNPSETLAAFIAFVRSEAGADIITAHGYDTDHD